MDSEKIRLLSYSSNPLERVKSSLLTRIETIENFPTRGDDDNLRIEAFATAVATIDKELALETLLGDQINAVVARVDKIFADKGGAV